MSETVILVHGIWMPAWVMRVLARRLRRCGYRVAVFAYRSLSRTIADNAGRLIDFIQGHDVATVHLLGHSLGGIVILQALQQCPDIINGRIVLLGSPVKGSVVAHRLQRFRGLRWMIGRSGANGLLGNGPDWQGHLQLGVIAGRRPLGLGRIIADLDGENDGTVGVAETRLEHASGSVVIDVSHTGLVYARAVADNVCRFLSSGTFDHPQDRRTGREG